MTFAHRAFAAGLVAAVAFAGVGPTVARSAPLTPVVLSVSQIPAERAAQILRRALRWNPMPTR
jgi:hypothetical protein